MKKCIYTLLVPILAALALGSCESIVYDDEYSKDGFYHGQNNVYFYYKNPDDTLRQYSFGAQPESMTSQTVHIPVRLWASRAKRHRNSKLRWIPPRQPRQVCTTKTCPRPTASPPTR